MFEVERKFRLSGEQKSKIASILPARYGESTLHHQADKIFLQRTDSFKDFVPGDPVMRLRQTDEKIMLTYKRAVTDGGDRIEHELSIDSFETAEALLKELGYKPVVMVDKVRAEYREGDMAMCLDEVKGLGAFLEIEIIAATKDEIGDFVERIMSLALELGLSEEDLETKKYDQLVAQASS